jgi:hypothetical protein
MLIDLAGGISCPSSITVSHHKLIASWALAIASSSESPALKQPGKSGTTTPKLWSASPGSMAMMKFMVNILLFQASLFQQFVRYSLAQI